MELNYTETQEDLILLRISNIYVVYITHNIQVRELIRSVAEWREKSEQREPPRTEWSGTPD